MSPPPYETGTVVEEGNETALGKKAASGGSGKVVEDKVAKEESKKVSFKKGGANGKKDLESHKE